MTAWEQIQETIEYIETHIGDEIRIEKLAETACLSPFYFQRLFHKLVGKSTSEYIKLRRLAKAKDALLKKDVRIIDIALEHGFLSHEHFTRAFRSTFGMTPGEYRKNPLPLNCMTKPELLLQHMVVDEGVPLVTDGIVLEITRKQVTELQYYAGYKAKLPIDYGTGLGTESGVDSLGLLWEKFHAKKKQTKVFADYCEEIGVVLPSSEKNYYQYFAGARVAQPTDDGEFLKWEIIPGEYIICTFEAENHDSLVMDGLYKAQQYLFSTWLPKHQVATETFCIEMYNNHTSETVQMELWLKVKK